MTAFQARFINFLARIRKMLGGALSVSHARKINAQTPNDASIYCRGRGISPAKAAMNKNKKPEEDRGYAPPTPEGSWP